MNKFIVIVAAFLFLNSCKDDTTTPVENTTTSNDTPTTTMVKVPDYNADNAYELIKQQLAFGPRVPGTPAQKKCADWIIKNLTPNVDTVYIQKTTVTVPIIKKNYPCINIIGSINPTAEKRILLLCHWDSRPYADEDVKDKNKPILAADDGASGVATLLEIAAQMKTQKPTIGIDFLFVDVEDAGKTEYTEESYCLGTQFWANNPHVPNYKANFGICLDMVGAKGALFPKETFSTIYASEYQNNIWRTAQQLGYGSYFVMQDGGQITDDHLVVNTQANIPCVNIINLQANGQFGAHWHTHQDNLDIIDKATLKAVGQTVMQVVYNF
jgi:hypothetical protein